MRHTAAPARCSQRNTDQGKVRLNKQEDEQNGLETVWVKYFGGSRWQRSNPVEYDAAKREQHADRADRLELSELR